MTIYLPNSLNISKHNLTKIALQKNSHKSVRTFSFSSLLSSKFHKTTCYENAFFENYLTDNNNNETRNAVIKFDEKDFNRLEIKHHIFRIIWNSNFSVPLQHQLSTGSVRVLEVGYVLINRLTEP